MATRESLLRALWSPQSLSAAALAAAGLAVMWGNALPAAESAARPAAGKSTPAAVQSALREGLDGRSARRAELLETVLSTDPNCAPAHWHLGQVKIKDQWVPIGEVATLDAQDLRLARYRSQRKDTPDTVAGHLELARWCAKQGLTAEARAHWTHIIDLSPEHAEARAQLGHRLLNGQWQTAEEQATDTARANAVTQALKKWRAPLESIVKQLSANNPKQRELALGKLRAIDDPEAIVALETFVAPVSEQVAALAIEVIAKIDTIEAARALARQSLVSPWPTVRASAAQQLKFRPVEHYVPGLLATMYTPVQSRAEVYQTPAGRLMYRHLFYREGQNQRQLAVLDTEFRYGGGDVGIAYANAVAQLQDSARDRERMAAAQNRLTAEINERACRALASATGVNPRTFAGARSNSGQDAAQGGAAAGAAATDSEESLWWGWWSERTEVFTPEKETRGYQQLTRQEVYGPASSGGEGSGLTMTPGYECLAAGTVVMTVSGPTAIEKIQVGDSVLSQDPVTGELTFKPVLRTTIRPASRLLKLQVGSDTLETTGGHPFWVAGQGWLKARDLKAGMKLHCPTGAVAIESVTEGAYDFTYNLVVADFHTYCVGKSQLLSHDNTVREASEAAVPGLAK